MEKFVTTFLLFLFIFLNTTKIMNSYAENTFIEGVYKAADFNISEGDLYSVSNVSSTN